jgi:hypothetical protein
MGRGSSVGIVTGYRLDGPGIEFRWRVRDFAHMSSQPGPAFHPVYCTVGIGSFSEVQRPVLSVDHTPYLVPRLTKEYS